MRYCFVLMLGICSIFLAGCREEFELTVYGVIHGRGRGKILHEGEASFCFDAHRSESSPERTCSGVALQRFSHKSQAASFLHLIRGVVEDPFPQLSFRAESEGREFAGTVVRQWGIRPYADGVYRGEVVVEFYPILD